MKNMQIRDVAIGIALMILIPFTTNVGIKLMLEKPETSSWSKDLLKRKTPSELQASRQQYFYTSVAVGIGSLIIGSFLVPVASLAMGFILGGAITLISGYTMYWSDLNDFMKFSSLLLALIILIFASLRFRNIPKKSRR